jgi:hypothetical protein
MVEVNIFDTRPGIKTTAMTLDEATTQLQAVLNAKTSRLVAEIQRMIVQRPFLLNEGVPKAAVNGIHFEYEWDSFLPIACPLNTTIGYCGGGEPLALFADDEDQLFPTTIGRAVLEATPMADRESVQELLDSVMTQMYCSWFAAAWKLARSADPAMRGFLSVHDTIWRTELDTGEQFREDTGPVRFF